MKTVQRLFTEVWVWFSFDECTFIVRVCFFWRFHFFCQLVFLMKRWIETEINVRDKRNCFHSSFTSELTLRYTESLETYFCPQHLVCRKFKLPCVCQTVSKCLKVISIYMSSSHIYVQITIDYIYPDCVSIYTLIDLGVSSNLIGSLSLVK